MNPEIYDLFQNNASLRRIWSKLMLNEESEKDYLEITRKCLREIGDKGYFSEFRRAIQNSEEPVDAIKNT